MQFITSLFGGSDINILAMVFALGVVIVGIVLLAWLLKVVFNASGTVVRGRNRRLWLVEALALDPKRQLMIVRRDGVEHLILIGGPQDLVVETGIVPPEAPIAASQPPRRPAAPSPQRRPAPAPKAEPAARPDPSTTLVEHLRERGQPTDKRAHLSLRHTGLLRPVDKADMPLSPENAAPATPDAPDSAKQDGTQAEGGGGEGGNLEKKD
ncbi:hypothetical protein [Devosia sp.]|uniref:hypothetical protein n=1 Tax=Devosia sp. TaxID=1871048 RepID=UPI002AFDEF9C|nr:hypothetical protein [Devosia sp.]